VAIQPGRHALGLLYAFRGKAPPEIGFARLGFGMAPKNQVHRTFRLGVLVGLLGEAGEKLVLGRAQP
jgi:hypothetical protein